MILKRVAFRIARLFKLDEEQCLLWVRRLTLHSSGLGFGVDFVHECIGKAMIFAEQYERVHMLVISWSAWAAVLVVYSDDAKHRVEEKKACKREASVNEEEKVDA